MNARIVVWIAIGLTLTLVGQAIENQKIWVQLQDMSYEIEARAGTFRYQDAHFQKRIDLAACNERLIRDFLKKFSDQKTEFDRTRPEIPKTAPLLQMRYRGEKLKVPATSDLGRWLRAAPAQALSLFIQVDYLCAGQQPKKDSKKIKKPRSVSGSGVQMISKR